eukprot:jgi/Tetstr1/442299/TSEL_030440.t1
MADQGGSVDTASVPPRLRRAVARCCLSGQPFPPRDATRVLQEYLADPSTVDAVYREILERGSAEPYSLEAVSSCVRLLKAHLSRYTPSSPVLEAVSGFTGQASQRLLEGHGHEDLSTSKAALQSLAYVRSLVLAAQGGSEAGAGGIAPPAASLVAHPITTGTPLISRHSSFSQRPGGGLDAVAALWHSSLAANQPGRHRRSLSDGISATISATYLANVSTPREVARSSSQSDVMADGSARGNKHSINPSWGGSSEGGLSALLHLEPVTEDEQRAGAWPGGTAPPVIAEQVLQQRFALERAVDKAATQARWSLAAVAEASSNLAALVAEGPPGAPRGFLQEDAEQYIGVTDVAATRRHIGTVVKVQRIRSRQTSSKEGERPWQQLSMLFQYRPYSEQAPLALSPGDVGAVVEAVKGNKSGGLPQAAEAGDAAEGAAALWGNSLGRGSMANVCSSLLTKVVMDMWISAGPDKSFPVVLEMLLDMVGSEVPALQERAFDIVYNLSLHAQLLYPADPAPPPEAAEADAAEPHGQGQPGMEAWLRQLLFALLPMLQACGRRDEAVWAAALGAFLHLTAASGTWSRGCLEGLHLGVVAGFLRAVQEFSWSPELHCHFVRLAANLLYAGGDMRDCDSSGIDSTAGEGPWWGQCRLDGARLGEFGGAGAVLRTFMAAPSPESRQNLLCVLLEALLPAEEGAPEGWGPPSEELQQLAQLAERLSLAELLRPMLLAARAGLGGRLVGWLQEMTAELDLEVAPRLLALLQVFLDRLEDLSTRALNAVSPSLEAVVADTAAAVGGEHGSSGGVEAPAWACLQELLWSSAPGLGAAGEAWLGRLLAAAADRHAEAMWDVTPGDEGLALMPALLAPATAAKCKGIAQQPGLSGLLAAVLGPDCPSSAVPLRVLRAAEALLHHIRVSCAARDAATPSGSRHSSIGRPRASPKVSASVLATFEVAVEWVLSAPGATQQPALLAAVSPAHAFMAGQTVVPHSLLEQVPLGLLVRLFNNFLAEPAKARSSTIRRLAHRGLGSSDVQREEVDWSFMGPGGLWVGNLRSALLLLIIGRCAAQPAALKTLGGEGWFHRLLNHADASVSYYSAVFLLTRLMASQPVRYHKALHRLVLHAQQTDDEELLTNPYLQISAMLEMKLVDG